MEKVSVIMATYNTKQSFLEEAISSILNQTYEDLELIIVCDGSKDEYDYISTKYNSSKIRLLFNDTNKGLPYSLNRAIEVATGQYIARMDSDDISLPSRIAVQLKYLKANKLDICGANAVLFGNEKGIKRIIFNSIDEVKSQILYRATLIHPTVLCKRSVFEQYKYDESFMCSQDFELWGRVIEKCNIGIYPKPLLRYRIHGGQASVEKQLMQKQNSQKIIQANVSRYFDNDQKIYRCFWLLSGRETLSKSDVQELDQLISYTISHSNNHIFKKEPLVKVLNNRFFELSIKNRIFIMEKWWLKRIIRHYNIHELIVKMIDRIRINYINVLK